MATEKKRKKFHFNHLIADWNALSSDDEETKQNRPKV
jgi:hypothetical protein